MAMDPKSEAAARARREAGAMSVLGNVKDTTGGKGVELNRFQEMMREASARDTAQRSKEFLESRLGDIPPDSTFASAIKGVESLTLNPSVAMPKPGELRVTVRFQTPDGKTKETDIFCTPATPSTPFRRFPPDVARLGSDQAFFKEIVDAAEILKRITWHEVSGAIIIGDEGGGDVRELNFDPSVSTPKETIECPERLKFLAQLPGIQYGFIGTKGFQGYQGIALEDGVFVLDHSELGNAAYVGTGLPRLSPERDQDTQVQEAISGLFRAGRTRGELREMGALPVVHRGNWQERITAAIGRVRAETAAREQAQ